MSTPHLEYTPGDVLLGIWRDPDTPPTVVPTWSVDNTRGELDALRIGRDAIILHGGEFAGGPTYWVTVPGTLSALAGVLIPDEMPTYHDTTDDARATVLAWVTARTTTDERIES